MSKQAASYFDSTAEFLAAIVAAATAGPGYRDHRLAVGPVGLNEGVLSEGGFLAPTSVSANIWQRAVAVGQILQRVSQQPFTSNRLELPAVDEFSRKDGSRYGGVALKWTPEGASIPVFQPKFSRIALQRKKLAGICYATDELIQDAEALAGWFERVAPLEIASIVEQDIISGNGAGRPLGFLNSPATIVVTKEVSQAAGTVTSANVTAMIARLFAGSFGTAVWIMSGDVYAALSTSLQITTDGRPTLRGFPVIVSEACSPVGIVGDIVLADLSQYLLSDVTQGTSIRASIHLRFLDDQTAFRLICRVDGQPGWSSAVTSQQGSATVSPFVVVESRP